MTTAESLRRSIESHLRALLDLGPVLLPNAITAENEIVSWAATRRSGPLVDFLDYATIDTYRRWAIAGEYSALLFDGSLLQMHYVMSEGEVVGHRLAYVPCPYRLDTTFLETEPVEDVLNLYSTSPHHEITMQSAVRFDFDLSAATHDHPAAHLTLNVASCRIACESPMHPAQFLRFVFRNFYSPLWTRHSTFFDTLTSRFDPSTVTESQRTEPHVAWRQLDAS